MATSRTLTAKTSKGKGFGAKSGGGRPPRPSAADQNSIARARQKGHNGLELAVDCLLDAMKATNEYGPDHSIRVRAAAELCDRFGAPKKSEVETSDKKTDWLEQVQDAYSARRAAQSSTPN